MSAKFSSPDKSTYLWNQRGYRKVWPIKIIPTKAEDSVSFIIIGINQKVGDEYEIFKKIVLKLYINYFISESNFWQIYFKGFSTWKTWSVPFKVLFVSHQKENASWAPAKLRPGKIQFCTVTSLAWEPIRSSHSERRKMKKMAASPVLIYLLTFARA